MPTEPWTGTAVLVEPGSVGNLTDDEGNHWVCFEHGGIGLVVRSYPHVRNGMESRTYEVLIGGETYEFAEKALSILSVREPRPPP